MSRQVVLAFLSGIPALVYEVVWTREVALLSGSQVEAISVVLVAFFGGLALGARLAGPLADRARHPFRLYAALEIAAGLLALVSVPLLREIGARGALAASEPLRLASAAAILCPVTMLLGGTLPALVRSAAADAAASAPAAGAIVGANTSGSVAGVAVATLCVPLLGLRLTITGAGLCSLAVGLLALALARGDRARAKTREPSPEAGGALPFALALAALAGVATLAYEVVAARAAALRLGSSLFAWSAVLGLFLAGLALGNAGFARRAGRTRTPEADLGGLEAAAALAIALSPAWFLPAVGSQATGLTAASLLAVTLGVLPPALLMGAAFPLFVRLGVRRAARVGGAFGRVSAANTAGGIAGVLLAPFLLLPHLGLDGAALACAGLNALLAAVLLVRSRGARASGWLRAGFAAAAVAGAALAALSLRSPPPGARVLSVDHGRQASAVVLRVGGRRELLVDGDPEASTAGSARRTEELLAILPLALHPDPRRFLEVGLGSGITLATAARFPLERIDCVEISAAVTRSVRYFAPDNDPVATGSDPRLRIARGDGRAFLARHPREYDVVVANTVQPWSVGATGLYSREYFARMAGALRAGGVAAQWLPVERIGARDLAAILRTFFAVFPHGGVWWGAENLILIGSTIPLSSGISVPEALHGRRLASAEATRRALGPGETLSDDRPALEARGATGRARGAGGGELALLEKIAREGAARDPAAVALSLWIQSRVARQRGDAARADSLEALATDVGLGLARQARAERRVGEAYADLAAGRLTEAESSFRRVLAEVPEQRDARLGLAMLAQQQGRLAAARAALEGLLAAHPHDAEAWNQLGALLDQAGEDEAARRAFGHALRADPFFPEALANAGLLAAEAGDAAGASSLLARLRAISPLGPTPGEQALREALAAGGHR